MKAKINQIKIMKKLTTISLLGIAGLVSMIGITHSVNAGIFSQNTQANTIMAQPKEMMGKQGEISLAKELQGKPVVVDIYATWCSKCKNIAPTLSSLKEKYKDKVNFVVFDVTDKKTSAASEKKAKELGLYKFFQDNKSKTSTVAIINPANGKVITQFRNNTNQDDYKKVLDAQIGKK